MQLAETQPEGVTALSQDIREKVEKIFPSVPIMIATVIAFLLTMVILYFLAYKPIKKAIKARQDYIQNNIDSASQLNEQAAEKLVQANLKLSEANSQADQIVQDGIAKSNKLVREYVDYARKTSKRMIEEARVNIDKEHAEFLTSSRVYIAQAATELSHKILGQSVNQEMQSQIIDAYLCDDSLCESNLNKFDKHDNNLDTNENVTTVTPTQTSVKKTQK
ncbi:F0F1 ATP synthase subunit B [Mycoplasmopsis columbinasalis]|uniref:ATP synthase subunit b n=1 Tax=Mycoplasmopsis columbinasalis TaxID=114880 RepID=A0A449BA45_9BACT|nr:F0F1 ATP synthase subunit B [Mycoplasmopsis columbinasalis]VEU77976.1 ATP synthase F0, B subunit [Mycoplasmopsis columbinasalis]